MIIRGETFSDWCYRTNNQSFLLRWDYEKNKKTPDAVVKTNNEWFYFLCPSGKHESYKTKLTTIIANNRIPRCPMCISFGCWCEDNNRIDFLKRWDYQLNGCSPYDVSSSSTKKMYFKCPRGIHEAEQKDLNNMRKQFNSGQCIACQSLGQYCLDEIDDDFFKKYQSTKNNVDLMRVSKNSMKKIWIRCQKKTYHPDYEISCANFYKGKRCPYCSGKRVAKEDSLGFLYPQSQDVWGEKKRSPFDFLPQSNKYIYWKCKKHGAYRRQICTHVSSDFVCPKCSRENLESKLQRKVSAYLSSKFDVVNHEYSCTLIPTNPESNYKLPYDNEIPEIKLIIEVNGEQHYKTSSFNSHNNGKTAEENLENRKHLDAIKKKYALDNGYSFLEIPYWTDDKKETWKMLIDRKIKSIA